MNEHSKPTRQKKYAILEDYGAQTFLRGQCNTRKNRPLSAIVDLKQRAEGATYERLQRVALVPNFQSPATPTKERKDVSNNRTTHIQST